eukprot:m.134029 g.134029  ORF g.134029 m.134029 type:complete len:604 (+) comp15814_c0_seq3:950-2761(+)
MYISVAYPYANEDVEIQIDNDAALQELGRKLVENAPASVDKESLLTDFTVMVARNGQDHVINLSLEQPVSILLESNDVLKVISGIPPYLLQGEPQPLQVLTFSLDDNQQTKTHINVDNLRKVLHRHDVKDLPVVVLSVAGPFRTGKSFLLNFILHYLENDGADWGQKSSMRVKDGFHWKHGIDRDTVGMWLWSKPFVRTLSTGEKVAVVVADTQGTFDRHTVMAENTRIFALNALISSQQIYNIKEKISEDILQQMHLFTEYGAMVANLLEGQKPFQNLEFLVRDWEFESHEPGSVGGRDYLDDVLSVSQDTPQELRDVRIWLRDCYETMTCYLMPHPGKKVNKSTFSGDLLELEEDFKDHMIDFVAEILSEKRIAVKRVGDQSISCAALHDVFCAYVEAFNTAELPEVQTIFKATARVNQEAIRTAVITSYRDAMTNAAGPGLPYIDEATLVLRHEIAHKEAMANFDSAKLLGSVTQKGHLRAELERQIDVIWKQTRDYNRSKDILRGMRTPLIFAGLAFVLNIVSTILDVVELDPIAYLLNFVAWVGVFALVGWGTLSYTGQQPELRGQLDSWADKILTTSRGFAQQFAGHMAKPQQQRAQ